MRTESEAAASLRSLLHRLQTHKIKQWGAHYREEIDATEELADLSESHVVGSRYVNGQARHAVVLDIDVPAWLVRSTTPNHFHLYIDVPGGVPHKDYMDLLYHLAKCGVIEEGYHEVSKKRGRSDVLLPWIKKEA